MLSESPSSTTLGPAATLTRTRTHKGEYSLTVAANTNASGLVVSFSKPVKDVVSFTHFEGIRAVAEKALSEGKLDAQFGNHVLRARADPTAAATTATAAASSTPTGPADRSESTGTDEVIIGTIVVIAVFALATLSLLFVVARRVSTDSSKMDDGDFDVVMGTGMPNMPGNHYYPTTGTIATAAANNGAVRNPADALDGKPSSSHYYPIGGALDDDWDVWISGLARAPKQSES